MCLAFDLIIDSDSILQKTMMKRTDSDEEINIVMREKEHETIQMQLKREQQEKAKPILLKQLQNELKHLDYLDEKVDWNRNEACLNDDVLQHLQSLEKEAKKYELKEIKKLCSLAIGKRVLNIELKKKREEHMQKMDKKHKIDMFFRENKIAREDYNKKAMDKLAEHSLIAKPYSNGKGFIESDNAYFLTHKEALLQSNYLNVIKEVNNIFYKNYKGREEQLGKKRLSERSAVEILFRLVWIPIICFFMLAITLPFVSFPFEQTIIIALLGLILLILTYISIKSFLNRPNDNNQMQQTIEEVEAYFAKINKENRKEGRDFEWICNNDFMWLECKFHSGFPKEQSQHSRSD